MIPYAMALKTLTLCVGNPAIFGEEPVKMTRAATVRTAMVARGAAPFNLALRPWFRSLWMDLERKLGAPGRDPGFGADSGVTTAPWCDAGTRIETFSRHDVA